MADYPCDFHLARYKGPSHRVYLNVFREDEEIRLKGSLCADCLAEVATMWVARALHQTEGDVWDPGDEDLELASLWRARTEPSEPFRRRR